MSAILSKGITSLPGERGVYLVPSSRPEEEPIPYRVDLEEFEAIGRCDCIGFEMHYLPLMEEAQERKQRIPVFQCAHLRAVRAFLGLEQLKCDPLPPRKRHEAEDPTVEKPKPKRALWLQALEIKRQMEAAK